MLANFLYDAWRFILKNLSIADEAPLQLYSSSLVFAPQNSVIKKKFAEYLPRCISHLPLVKVEWGADLQSLGDSIHGVNGLACSPDGGLIASIMKFGEINLWSTVTGTLRQSWKTGIGESTLIYGLAFSPDGKLLALGSSKGTSLWSMSSGTLSKALPNQLWSPSRPAFSPDGTALLLQDKSTQPSTLGLWDIAQSRFMQNLEGHIDGLKSLVISHNGQIVATGSDNGILRLWTLNVNRTVPTQIQAHSQPVESLAFSPDDDLIVTGSSDCENYVWTVKDSTRLHRLVDKENGYRADTSVEFSCDGRLVASGFGDGIINMWNSTSGESERSFSHPSPVKTMALSHTGELISGSSDGVVRIWDTCIEDQVSRVRHPDFSTAKVRVVMSPDGSLALAIRYSHGATVVDIATGSTMWLTGSDWIFSFDTIFSINNQLIAVALIMNVMIWDRASGKLIQDLRISNNKPVRYRIAFRPDNKLIIWVPGNGQLQVWDPISGKQLETLGTYDDMGFLTVSYDGQLLACTNGSTISIWDLSTKSSFNLENKNRCEAVAISPDNMTLVVLSGTSALGLWNLRSRRLYNYLSLLTWSETIHFSEDGKYITADKQSYHAESDGEGQVVSISLIDDQLRMENQWVYLGNERFLWIPEEYGQSKIYGGMTAHRRDQTLCLDSSHGNISCISFDRNARWDPL
ncbi:NACHT nucleoside triphosphatase [Penicillium expansum]|nr:NACHT nucleoside triphosphatase [Penicillium expansum]